MSRERVLQRRLRTFAALSEAIGALRSLSAQHFRDARAQLSAARLYRDNVQQFLGVLNGRSERVVRGGPAGIVLISSDLGLVGDYTARLVREALALRAQEGRGPFVCLGRRAVAPLARAGVKPDAVYAGPTSVGALTTRLLPLVDMLHGLQRRGELGSLWLVAARFDGAGAYTPVRVPVLPVTAPADLRPLASSPYCGTEHLRAIVVREYLYGAFYETLLEALASEHGKRLVTAESARSWLDERMNATRRQAAAVSRESSTQGVLEIAIAARVARLETEASRVR